MSIYCGDDIAKSIMVSATETNIFSKRRLLSKYRFSWGCNMGVQIGTPWLHFDTLINSSMENIPIGCG